MDADDRKCEEGGDWLENDLVYKVTGLAMTVLNDVGHGLREKTYERALCVEFRHDGMHYDQQLVFPVFYRGEHIDDYIPDLIVEKRIIIETKTVDAITDEHIGQMINYLRITKLDVGVILNFKKSKLEWKKVVLQKGR